MRDDYLFGAIALREGFITEDQLRACLAPDQPRPLRETLRARGWLTEDRIQAILDIQNVRVAEADPSPESGGLLGQIALSENLITPAALVEALREQFKGRDEGRPEPLGEILCRLNYITPQQRDDLLRRQDHHALVCPHCDTYYLVHGHPGGTRFLCRRCLNVLSVPDRPLSPGPESREDPGALGTIGPYAPLQEAGRGSMAVVFKALHRPTNRIVALKVLRRSASFHPALVQRFEREAHVAARLRHPHIARVLDTGVADGLPYIALEYIEGVTLRRVLREGRLRLRTVLEALRKSALAVQHAHESGVVHRDLKPANIVLDAAGDPHLMDFGLARIDGSEPAFVRPGAPLGTPCYMPPEQSRGDLAATDARSDVYALGVILYETLAGRVPFCGPTAMAVFREALSVEPLRPSAVHPAVPPELDALCLKALARRKEDRFPSAAALAGELRRFLEARPGFDPPLPPHPQYPPLEMESTG